MLRRSPNLVLIDIDTLRADHLGCYGYFRNTSPNLDRLAKEGVLFKDSHATAIATGPGQTSIITGLAPIHHHFYMTPYSLPNLIDFDDDIPTLAELIQDVVGGYTTAAFDNLINFKSHMDQFVRGFEYYVNATRSAKPIHHHLVGGDLNARLLPWLKAHAEERFFLFVHYWDPHTPYNQPDDYREIFSHVPGHLDDLEVKRAPAGYDYVPGWGKADEICEIWGSAAEGREWTVDLYDGEIRYVDELVGQVIRTLESLGLLEDTVVIITSDHGEQLGQHGMWGHGMLHEAVIYVPLIIWGPSVVPAGKVVSGYAQQADIAPTILALLGADETKLPRFDGMNLLPVIEGQEPLRDKMFAETSASRAMLDGRWKYIRTYYLDQEELYDLQSDPMEVNNLASQEEFVLEDMRGQLSAWIREGLGGQADPLWRQVATVAEAVDKVFGRQWRVPSVRSLRKGP